MEKQNSDTGYSDGNGTQGAPRIAVPPDMGSEALSLDPNSLGKSPPIQVSTGEQKQNRVVRILRRADVLLVILLILGLIGLVAAAALRNKDANKAGQNNIADNYDVQQIPLETFVVTPEGVAFDVSRVQINGTLQLNDSLVLLPSQQPVNPEEGQLYYDQNSNQLAYFNGTEFISMVQQGTVVQSIGGVTGAVTLGGGLGVVGNQLVATGGGVSSFGGQTGAISLGNGLGMSGNTVVNNGVVSLTPGTVNLTVTNDGSGNLTISSVGGGTGTVTSGGGTVGRIAKFTGVQNVEDSLLSESGATITVNGNLSVTGTTSLSNALTVPNGGTGATTLTNNGVLVGQGAAAITAVTGSPGDCLVVNGGGSPVFGACSGGSSVTSLNSLTGALTIANSTGLGSTITIDDATTAAKGIASFNATNFSVASGAVNTIQNINTAATPTFAGVNTNSITPSAALTVGATGQALTLQGNGGTVLTATNAGSTTTISFQAPTANVTYRFATAAANTYDICTTAGNCAGVGGGVTTPGGNTNRLAKFTAGSVIGDSTITDDGTNVITTADVVVQGGAATLGIANTQTGTLTLAYGSANFSGTIIQGALATANRTYTLPDADGTFCLSSGNCLGGGGGGANTALSNLTGVAINTTLLPGVAGAVNLGSGTLPFGDLFIAGTSGTPATNNFRITGASTSGTRTITLPDESGTVCTNASGSTTCQGNFILNQSAGDQTGDFRISGSGQANTSLLTPLLDTQSGTTVLAIGTNNATGGINLNQTTTIAANRNFVMASGTGTFAQTYTGTGTAHTITANSLTSGSAFNVNATNNTAGNTAWSSVLIDVTSAQSGTAVSTGTIAGFDVQFTQNAAVAGNVDTVANFSVKRNDSAATDQTVTSILNLANLDTAVGNQINVTDGLKINGGANIANALNLSGTFSTNLITSTNLTVAMSGNITTAGDAAINGGDITSTAALNVTPGGALVLGVTGQTATLQGSITTITSNGGGNDIILSSADTIELQGATNVTGTFSTSGIITVGALGTANTSTFLCRNGSNQIATCLTGGAGAAFVQDGNTFGATAVLGTNDNFGLSLEVNNGVVATISNTGAVNFINATNSTAAFNIENSTGGNLFTVDTTNSEIGISLGGGTTPSIGNAGLQVNGSIKMSGAGAHNFISPNGSSLSADFSVNVQSPSAFNQIIALGLDSSADPRSRAISIFDDRAVTSQPPLVVFDSTENTGIGLGWNGSTTIANVMTLDQPTGSGAAIRMKSGDITAGNGSSGAVYAISGSINGGTGGSTGALFLQTGDGLGTNSSSGNITLDSGASTGSGTAGTITIGGTNASALTLGRTGLTTANAGRLTVGGSTTGDALTVTNSTSTGAIAIFRDNATSVVTIGDGGAVTLQNETNQLSALQILTTAGSGGLSVFNADTINQRVGIGGVASASKFEVQGGDAAVYNSGNNPRLILGDSTSAGQNGFLQWDSTNDYIRLETVGTNGLKVNDNFVSIGNLFPDQPLKVGSGTTQLMQVNTTGQTTFQNGSDSTTAFQVLASNATFGSGVPQFVIDTSNARTYIGNPTADSTGALLVLDTKNTSGDPTGVNGAMYYNSNLGVFRCYQYDDWRDCNENARTSFHAYTDLMGSSGSTVADLHFFPFTSTGAQINDIAGVANHPGLSELEVAADNEMAALQSAGLDNGIVLGNGDTWRYEALVRIPTLSDGTNTYILRVGFLDTEGYAESDTNGGSNNAAGCYFKYSNAVNGGKWQGTCVNNSATVSTCDTASTSGTTVANNTWYRLTLTVNSAANSADFRVNGAATNGSGRCQVTAQIPTAGVGYTTFLMKTNGASARQVELDYVDVLGQFGTPR